MHTTAEHIRLPDHKPTMTQYVRSGFERVVDSLIDGILAFTDYFVTQKRVTLSETALFLFTFSWSVWFLFKGVYVSEMALGRSAWTAIFLMSAVAHFLAFLMEGTLCRAIVVSLYALIFCFLTLLSYYTGSTAPAAPTLAVETFLSVFIAVRLFREVKMSQ